MTRNLRYPRFTIPLLAVVQLLLWCPIPTNAEGRTNPQEREVESPTSANTARTDDASSSNNTTVTSTINAAAHNDTDVQYVKMTVQIDKDTTDFFVVEVHPSWAPIGAARFLELVDMSFYNDVRFFRVLEDFVTQFGLHGDPAVAQQWADARLVDDPVLTSNERGTLSFASAGDDSRTTQIFINSIDNDFLDELGFSPFAKVSENMDVVDQLYYGYGEGPPEGTGPSQQLITQQGNAYLESDFPLLSYIVSAERISAEDSAIVDTEGKIEESGEGQTQANGGETPVSVENDTTSATTALSSGSMLVVFSTVACFGQQIL